MNRLMAVVLVLSLGLFGLSVTSPLVFGGAADGPAVELRNGDANGDGVRELSDAIYLLQWLFGGGEEPVAIVCPVDQSDRLAELEAQLAAANATLQEQLNACPEDQNVRVSELEEQLVSANANIESLQQELADVDEELAALEAAQLGPCTPLEFALNPPEALSCGSGYSVGWVDRNGDSFSPECDFLERDVQELIRDLDFLRNTGEPREVIADAEAEIIAKYFELMGSCMPDCVCDGREYNNVCYPLIFAGGGNSTRSWDCDDIACFGFFGGSSNRFTIRVTNPDVEYVNISGGGSNNIHTVIVPAGKSDIVECNLGGANNRCVVIEE